MTYHVHHPTFGIGQWQPRNLGLKSSYDPSFSTTIPSKLLAHFSTSKETNLPINQTYANSSVKMASMITRRFFSTTVRRMTVDSASKAELQSESKRNPEIYVRHIGKGEALLLAAPSFPAQLP